MTFQWRPVVYFLAAACTGAAAGINDSMTMTSWVRLVFLSLAGGFVAVRAYFDQEGFEETRPERRVPPRESADVEDDLPRR